MTYVSVGANGRVSDGGVFGASTLSRALDEGWLNIPPPTQLPNSEKTLPHVILGDEAFPLKPYLIRPYPRRELNHAHKIFNYRLSRARRLIENVFGIMAATWRIFGNKIAIQPDKVETITLATCVLHNYLLAKKQICPNIVIQQIQDNPQVANGMGGLAVIPRPHTLNAKTVRDELCHYVNNEGAVGWQEEMI